MRLGDAIDELLKLKAEHGEDVELFIKGGHGFAASAERITYEELEEGDVSTNHLRVTKNEEEFGVFID